MEAGAAERQSFLAGWTLIAIWMEVVADVKGLVAAEIATARLEAADNIRFLVWQCAKIIASIALLVVMLALFVSAAVVFLSLWIGMLQSLLAIAAFCAIIGLLLLKSGTGGLSSRSPLPRDSMGRIARDLKLVAGHKAGVAATGAARHDAGREAE